MDSMGMGMRMEMEMGSMEEMRMRITDPRTAHCYHERCRRRGAEERLEATVSAPRYLAAEGD